MKQAIATVKKTKEIQEKYKVFTKKSFGQNFIIEPGVVEKNCECGHSIKG